MSLATIKQGNWVRILPPHPLAGEIVEVQQIVGYHNLEIYHQKQGLVDLRLKQVKETSPPSCPPTTPNSIVASIESLVKRYEQIGGRLDRRFVEQILGEKLVEHLFKSTDISGLDNKCSTENVEEIDNKCSTGNIEENPVEHLFKSPDIPGLDNKCSTESSDQLEAQVLPQAPPEEILPQNPVEHLFKSTDMPESDNKCSTENVEERSAPLDIPQKRCGRPPCRTNNLPPSGWIDDRKLVNGKSYYYCRYRFEKKIRKTKIPTGMLNPVEQMIKLKYPSNQIEDFLGDSEVDF
ncbi:MAG: hypothetical protein F6K40_38765 [Okeania sp. SIO3I5]|uniref:hypothetical protein n=1 Tax=Okeania sp. SIO3I5 TaxID=2607805 RepID=UPI0013B903D1|nr:hypothetical protein [Okeania sp. SIO3I5]NEQ41806.1 hypothetical protein [Okeania sp. SIO3I5]